MQPTLQIEEGVNYNIFRSYFSEDGLEYSLCRVPIGGTDFSTHAYSYVNETESDIELTTFALTEEDYELKVFGI